MSQQKKKRSKKYTPQKQSSKPAQTIKARCKVCKTDCKLWDGQDFITWRNTYAPDYKMDFLFVQECNCWETTDDWMEVI
jgi:hypothetical protein